MKETVARATGEAVFEEVDLYDEEGMNKFGLLGRLPLRKGQPIAKTWVKFKATSDDVELWLVRQVTRVN